MLRAMSPPPRPRALVDDAIVDARAALSPLVEPVLAPGAAIDRRMLLETGAEILITRSVTRVDEELIAGTALRFVATATAGVDHVDREALRARGVGFASAPGCNAPAVVHWVLTALASACARGEPPWRLAARGSRRGFAIVGYGNVGRRLARRLRPLGVPVVVSDPPLARAVARGETTLEPRDRCEFLPLDELLTRAAVVSLHVPLTRPGADRDPTLHLLSRARWPAAAVINTSRGAVVANEALREAAPGHAILDVWEGEPALPWALLQPGGPVRYASHHVAGYSRASKQNATRMIHHALARFLGRRPCLPAERRRRVERLEVELAGCDGPMDALARCLQASCALLEDDRRTRALLERPPSERARAFESLRRAYPLRGEPSQYAIDRALVRALTPWLDRPIFDGGAALSHALEIVGFTSSPPTRAP